MPRHDEPPADPDVVTFEAGTVEEAMERLVSSLGDDAEIVDAQKVHRGGIAGFFARERVELTARPRATRTEAKPRFDELLLAEIERTEPSSTSALPPAAGASITAPREDQSSEGATPDDETPAPVAVGPLAAVASEEIAPPPATRPSAPARPIAGDHPGWRIQRPEVAAPTVGPVAWGTSELIRHGAPTRLIDAVSDLDPYDDLGWIHGIADSVADLCGPLPSDEVVVVGTHANRFAELLDIPSVKPGGPAPYTGSFASSLRGSRQDREWLEFVRGGRRLHLIVGGSEGWRNLLVCEPTVVSWVGETNVLHALTVAIGLGARLGYGTVDGSFSPLVRALPVDVALAVRRSVGRH